MTAFTTANCMSHHSKSSGTPIDHRDRTSPDNNLPQLATDHAPLRPEEGTYISSRSRVNPPPSRRFSVDSNVKGDHRARQLPPELRFTPVNAPAENSGPLKPKRSVTLCPPQLSGTSQQYVRNCRLIGFTPLVEDSLASSDEDSIQFLGPRNVKAKEVAPCALFYKRADVFVSSEMKSQNVLSYSENHYRRIRFDDQVSISELEYAHQSSDQSDEVSRPLGNPGSVNQKPNSKIEHVGLKISLEPLHLLHKPIGHTFSKDGLTTMPLASESTSEFSFDRNAFRIFTEETDSAPPSTPYSGAGQIAPWASLRGLASDPEQSTSSAGSSGIHTNLWDTSVSSPTRATSPVSSIYSNISSSCHRQALAKSFVEDQCSKAECESMKLSQFNLATSAQILSTPGSFDWHEDNGSMADDENDSNCSSIPPESDDEQELDLTYSNARFQLIPAESRLHLGDTRIIRAQKLAEP